MWVSFACRGIVTKSVAKVLLKVVRHALACLAPRDGTRYRRTPSPDRARPPRSSPRERGAWRTCGGGEAAKPRAKDFNRGGTGAGTRGPGTNPADVGPAAHPPPDGDGTGYVPADDPRPTPSVGTADGWMDERTNKGMDGWMDGRRN